MRHYRVFLMLGIFLLAGSALVRAEESKKTLVVQPKRSILMRQHPNAVEPEWVKLEGKSPYVKTVNSPAVAKPNKTTGKSRGKATMTPPSSNSHSIQPKAKTAN